MMHEIQLFSFTEMISQINPKVQVKTTVLEIENVKFYDLIRKISYLKFFPIDIDKNLTTDAVKK